MSERERETMEFDLLKNPHPHPLIFYQQGKPDGQVDCCSRCRQPWRPPAFGCSDCNFHLHQSCIDLPPEIHTPFHPHHKRPLSSTNNNDSCNCCAQKPYGDTYRCPECSFQIDVQCAIADTKASGLRRTACGEFRHFSHPHPLTLLQEQQWGNTKVVCLMCQLHIKSGSTYFCSSCDSHFHQQCAELPREILNLDYHDHPLFLFAQPFEKNNLCESCRNGCVGFFYGCPPCNFNLHVACLSSFKHQHDFAKLEKVLSYKCQVCGKDSKLEVLWFCSICHLFAHKKCAELPSRLKTSEHDHSLTLTFSLYRVDLTYNICKICGGNINTSYARYVCHDCSYGAHLDCAKNRQTGKSEDEEQDLKSMLTEAADPSMNANNNGIIQENGIQHFSHKHKLTLCPGEDKKHCNGCMQCITTQSYGCPECGFYLHEECARLPRRHMNSSLHLHELSMVYIPDFVFSCGVCLQYCHGFAYRCEKCHYAIDTRCAAIKIPFTHLSHHHSLSLYKGNQRCKACGEWLENKLAFGCEYCDFYLDARCANLPLAIRNRFDEHPLSLTFVNEDHQKGKEYYCDICEEKRKAKRWFYYCRMCCFAAHLSCALGEYPFLKSAEFEGHRHPLNLVKEGKKGYSACGGGCEKSCDGKLAFECGRCKFNVHACGPCYHKQLTQGRVTFTMPSLYSRSLGLYLDPIQRKRSKPILLGRYGGRGGSPWNERVFSAIREFMVNHGRWIDSIQIEYEENGKSFWSIKNGRDGGSRSKEEELEEEDVEVAMSLGQYGGAGGSPWDDGVISSIKQVVITHGECIDSILIQYDDSSWSERHGGNRGHESKVVLEYPDEYLISIHGFMGDLGRNYVIRSLTLESNKQSHGPYGTEEGTRFWFPTTGAKIVGFHGRSNHFLDAIGIKVVPIDNNPKTAALK